MVALDVGNEPTGQEDNAQDDPDEQPHEGVGVEGAILEEPLGQRPGHRRRLPERVHRREQRLDDDESWRNVHAPSDHHRGGGRPQLGYAARPPKHTARASVHHQPHEEGRRGGRSDQRLEVRGDGGGPVLPDHLHDVHDHRDGGRAAFGAAHNRAVGAAG